MTMALVSRALRAYFRLLIQKGDHGLDNHCGNWREREREERVRTDRFRIKTIRGMQSRSLWGPGDGRGA